MSSPHFSPGRRREDPSTTFHKYLPSCVAPARRWSLLDQRVYLSGFLDHNLWLGGDDGTEVSTLVTEHQVGVRLFDQLYAGLEFRRNEFFAEKSSGVGFGIQYGVPLERAQERKP